MTNLSPAAQAVMDAYYCDKPLVGSKRVAAALRAVADGQTTELEVPFDVVDEWEKVKGSCASFYAAAEWGQDQAVKKLRTIAAELEGAQ